MPRLRNKLSGVVVNVDDDTAERLGDGYEVADKTAEKPQVTAKKSSPRKSKK